MMRPSSLLAALLGGLTVAAACNHRHVIAVVSHSSAMGGAGGTASGGGGGGSAGGAGGAWDGGGNGAGGVLDAGGEPIEAGVPDVGPSEAGVPDVGGDGAADHGKDGGLPPVNIVSQGGSSLIDLFAVPQALYVVTSTALMAFDANDGPQFEHDFSREVTAAAQEGDLVAVANRAAVTPFTQLVPGTETLLVEACASAVIVGGNRFVCGPFDDANRVFRTYDLDARAAIAQSDSYVYIGIPMRRVPGRDSFVSVDVNQFPSDFRLFDVDSTGRASYVNESPYHGDFPVTPTYAFDATPGARVIQETGLILDIYGSAASPCTSAFPPAAS